MSLIAKQKTKPVTTFGDVPTVGAINTRAIFLDDGAGQYLLSLTPYNDMDQLVTDLGGSFTDMDGTDYDVRSMYSNTQFPLQVDSSGSYEEVEVLISGSPAGMFLRVLVDQTP